MEEKYPCPKMTAKQWVVNFWYYYKWFFLTAFVIVLFLVICTVQYFTKSEADVSILYVGSANVSREQAERIVFETESMVQDSNSDGKVRAEIKTITLLSDFDFLSPPEKVQAHEQLLEYSNEIIGGNSSILLLESYFYEELASAGALMNLYEIFPEIPSGAIDFYGIRLGSTALYQREGFSSLPADTILCLKYHSAYTDDDIEEQVAYDLINQEHFRNLYAAEK